MRTADQLHPGLVLDYLGGRSRPTAGFSAIVPTDGARADEDYARGGPTGEIAALLLEPGTHPKSARVAVESTIPFAPHLEYAALPNAKRITAAKGPGVSVSRS